MRFQCRVCGEVHEGLADIGFEAPYYYYTVPERERDRRCRLTPDLCVIDGEDHFVRGVLEIPIEGTAETFGWGVWSSVSERNFRRYERVFEDDDPARYGPFPGWLSSRIPGYDDTLSLVVRAHLGDARSRPRLELEPVDHPLARDQREGIDPDRLARIVERSIHSESDR